jgi:hypothetical protein
MPPWSIPPHYLYSKGAGLGRVPITVFSMSGSFFSRILLPAVAVAGVAFVGLLGVLGTVKPAPFQVDVQPTEEGQPQPVLTARSNDLTVRYVGLATIFSTGAGLLTMEVLRKVYAIRDTATDKAEQLGLDRQLLAELAQRLETEPQAALGGAADPEMEMAAGYGDPLDRLTSPPGLDAGASPTGVSGSVMLLDNPRGYTLCHGGVGDRTRLLLVCGEVAYLFLRLAATEAQAYTIATHQADQGDRVIITPYKQRYAIWCG